VRALVVHGGAGTAPADSAPERACQQALALGWEILAGGGSAVDAVVAAVIHMENEPSLNAGYGACLTDAGTVELDASIMEGCERRAGAVALIRRVRNPIALARLLMGEDGPVFMVGGAAEDFAAARGLVLADPDQLVTPERRRAWDERNRPPGIRDTDSSPGSGAPGTVGAVALDTHGHVAAATSTGGFAWKRPGRVGDSAVIGAGTFADDRAGAASCTGQGEAIIRGALASHTVDLLRDGLGPEPAASRALAEVSAVGGTAGVIVLDRFGRVAGAHTSAHMTWCSRQSA
jgi:beta-aspartyl-peptidase (threonine type)